MYRHLADLRAVLRPGAQLAYVVGDQASYLRIMIRTGQLLAQIGQSLGYELVGIDPVRSRLATATREMLREEVVVLRWPGPSVAAVTKALRQSRGNCSGQHRRGVVTPRLPVGASVARSAATKQSHRSQQEIASLRSQ